MEMHIPALQSFKLLQHFLGKDLLKLVTIETAKASIKVQELLKIGIQHCFCATLLQCRREV
jgi:hypothetical protein